MEAIHLFIRIKKKPRGKMSDTGKFYSNILKELLLLINVTGKI